MASKVEMRRWTHPVGVLLAIAPLLYSVGALFFGWVIGVMQCDEICDENSTTWRGTQGAWQWYAILGLGVATFVAGLGLFASVLGRRPWRALTCLLLGAATTVTPLAWIAATPPATGETPWDYGTGFYVLSVIVFVAGVLAACLAGTSRVRGLSPDASTNRMG
jgi:uncharacterized membrane protein YkgB